MASPKTHPTAETRVETDRQRTRLWLKLLQTTRSIENELRRKLQRNFCTTLPRFDVMAALYRNKTGMNMGALSKALMVSNGNVTGIVERLVSEGLLLRLQGEEDRRINIIRLSKKGQQAFEEMAAAHREWVAEIFDRFDSDQAENLMDFLKVILESETSANEQ